MITPRSEGLVSLASYTLLALVLACGSPEETAGEPIAPTSVPPTPERTAPERTAPERTAPERTAPERQPAPVTTAVYVDGFGGRFEVDIGTQVTLAPDGGGSLIGASEDATGLQNFFVRVGGQAPTLIPGANGRIVGIRPVPDGARRESWRIIAGSGSVAWPSGYKLVVVDAPFHAYQLMPTREPAAPDTFFVVKWPRDPQDFAGRSLVASYQRVVSDHERGDIRRLELAYEYNDIQYRQLNVIRRVGDRALLVSGAAAEGDHAAIFRAIEATCESFEALGPDEGVD